MYYKIHGQGDPVLILHGLYGMSDNWMSVVRKMKGDFQFILPDLRNHGQSENCSSHTYEDMVGDVLELLDTLHLEKVSILGHSMGGKLAMRFALRYPYRVDKLIVVDIAPKNYLNASNFGRETARHEDILRVLSKYDISGAGDRKKIDALFKEDIPNNNLRAFLLKNIERDDNKNFRWKINIPVLSDSLDEIMDGFSGISQESLIPALFVRGDLSAYIHPDDLFYIKKYFPNAQLVTISNAGHWVHAEQPEKLINAISFFLR